MLDFFKLKDHGTTVKTEFGAGLSTFLAMLYIVPVNALILSDAGMPKEVVLTATALITTLACIFNGLWSNTPISLSTGMGLNAFFAYTLVLGHGIAWQTALGVVFISSAIFVVLSFTHFRLWIIRNIPLDMRRAISAGIGAFICFIGLKQMGLIVSSDSTLVAIGDISEPKVLLGLFGVCLMIVFWTLKTKGGFVLAVALCAIFGWISGIYALPSEFVSLPVSIAPTFGELDILGALKLSLLPAILTFFVTHLFDSIGTLTGVSNRAHIFSAPSKENEKKISRNLECDAISSTLGSVLGTSTITPFIESASGVEAGGRTGLTAIFCGLFFVLTLFFLPLFGAIPQNALYPILVITGVLMFSELGKIDYSDPALCISSFFMVIMMPLTYSITIGLGFGFLAYVLVKLAKRDFGALNAGIITLCAFSLLCLVLTSAPTLLSF